MNGIEQTYIDYVFLKQHFKKPQFIWNEGHRYSKAGSVYNRKDQPFFQRFHDLYSTRKERIEHLISAFLLDPSVWIGKLPDESIILSHKDRMSRAGALEYTFEKDCSNIEWFLIENSLNLDKILLTTGTKHPIIVSELQEIGISWETLCLLDHFHGFFDLWFPIDPIWKERRIRLNKYTYVLNLKDRNLKRMLKCYQLLVQS
jgi:hypothetical protein